MAKLQTSATVGAWLRRGDGGVSRWKRHWPLPPPMPLPAGTGVSLNQASLLPSLPRGLSALTAAHTLFPIFRIKDMQMAPVKSFLCPCHVSLQRIHLPGGCDFVLLPLVLICAAPLRLLDDTFLLVFRHIPVPFVWLLFFFLE